MNFFSDFSLQQGRLEGLSSSLTNSWRGIPKKSPILRDARYAFTLVRVALYGRKAACASRWRYRARLTYRKQVSAIDALKQWKFTPSQKDGKDVDVTLNFMFNFQVH